MTYKYLHVVFPEDEVSTLADLAADLKSIYGWESWHIDETGCYIVFTAKDSEDGAVKEGYVGTSGFAYRASDGFEEEDNWDEYNVDWYEDFDGWSNFVWGSNESGQPVMVHN